jgi:hypothetical protein
MMKLTSPSTATVATSSSAQKTVPSNSQIVQARLASALEAIRLDSRDSSDEYLEDSVARFGGE